MPIGRPTPRALLYRIARTMAARGRSMRHVARMYGVSTRVVQRAMREYGIEPNPAFQKRAVTPGRVLAAIAKAYVHGDEPERHLALRFDVDRSVVQRAKDLYSLKTRRGQGRRIRERKQSILARYVEEDASLDAIGAEHGVSAAYVSQLGRGIRKTEGWRGQRRNQVRPRGEQHPQAKLSDAERSAVAFLGELKVKGEIGLTWAEIREGLGLEHISDMLCLKITNQALEWLSRNGSSVA